MKKFILTAMAVIMCSTNAFAYTENRVTKDLAVKVDKEITGASAPALVIDECDDFGAYNGETVEFSLVLSNAQWLYDGSGVIENGIRYSVISSNEMMVSVDTSEYDAVSRGISIPLYTKVTDTGYATVTVDPKDSPVSSGTYVFAHSGYPDMEIKISASEEKNSAFNISINDEYPYQVVNGRIYELKLSNGFVFTGKADVKATGKYSGITEFSVDKNKSVAYIKLDSTSVTGSGTINISNIGIEPSETSKEGEIQLSINAINNSGLSKTIYLGSYTPNNTDTTTKDSDKEENKGNENATTGDTADIIKFTVGSQIYYVDSIMYKTDVKPYINSQNRTMVPLRAAANAFGISDDNIKWVEGEKRGVEINFDGKEIFVPADKSNGNYIEINGVKTETDSTAEIRDSRIYLPLRSIAAALGIDDENIGWNGATGEITIKK